MISRKGFFLFIALLLLFVIPAHSDTITLAADSWMPFNGDGITETGYMLDIAKLVFESKGFKVEFVVAPWARAINQGRKGEFTAIVGAAFDDAPDFVYPVEEQGLGRQVFYAVAGSKWEYAGIPSLKGLRLAIIKDYSYFDALDEYLSGADASDVSVQFGDLAIEKNLNMLLMGRVDAVVDEASVLKYTIAKMNIGAKLAFAGNGGEAVKMYIAFSPKNPKSAEYAKMLSDGMSELRKSGELRKVLAKYGLTDWK